MTVLDLSFRVWSLDCRSCFNTLYGHTSKICSVDSISSIERVVTGSEDATVRLWKPSTESHSIFRRNDSVCPIDSVCMLNSSVFISGSQSGTVSMWSVGRKKPAVTVENAHGGGWITALVCR